MQGGPLCRHCINKLVYNGLVFLEINLEFHLRLPNNGRGNLGVTYALTFTLTYRVIGTQHVHQVILAPLCKSQENPGETVVAQR